MNTNQFELALTQTKPSDWSLFETLCSKFLASEHPSMRTMASASGDGGRDAALYSPEGDSIICAQYSVSKDWEKKIKNTHERLKENFNNIKVLIYLTNQEIGSKGDKIKNELLQQGIFLDIRDKNWFLERLESNETRRKSAEDYYDRIGRPYLEGHQVISTKRSALSNKEAKAALVYLAMQWEDTNTDKGLTKLSYEALVLSAIRYTNAEKPMSRLEIHSAIHSYLPSQQIETIQKNVNSALSKLDKKTIKHRIKEDTFHLAFEEQQRLSEKLVHQDLQERALDQEIFKFVGLFSEDLKEETIDYISKITKQILDLALLKSGENFAISVLNGSVHRLDKDLVNNLIIEKISNIEKRFQNECEKFPRIIELALNETITSQNEIVRRHLKTLSDTYTLFAFLQETDDVQKATKKIFSFGKIWLDTTLVLPLLAEKIRSQEEDKKFSRIVSNLINCGVSVYICKSVIDEVINHIRLATTCAQRTPNWQGRVPYLLSQYLQEGHNSLEFSTWVSLFRGEERPEQDIQDFLENEFNIKYDELTDDYERANETLRFAVERLWREAHERRRQGFTDGEPETSLDSLIRNDVISYLGIIERRNREKQSELGYQHWWLTIDSTAWEIRDSLKTELPNPPSSPLMSLDFLVQHMSFGPNKNFITRSDEQLLPVLLDLDIAQVVPAKILHIAETVRQNSEGQPEYVIRRKVRDACDKARRQVGDFARGIKQI